MRAGLAGLVALLALVATAGPAAAADHVVFRFLDPAIVESSALVDLGATVVTANDSGNAPDLYLVDARTGSTVGVTHLHVPGVDIEALAPAGGSHVWVGDIGDNGHQRSSVSVARAPVARGRLDATPTSYRLAYPDGPHDAESLVAAPDGRLYVITKEFTGGTVYRAPQRLDARRVNRLQRVARVPDFATDAAVLPDGRHVVVRTYWSAVVYTFPGFRRLGSFQLPAQRQGEGISVGPDGRILLSSEGVHQPVLQVTLPTGLEEQVTGRSEPSAWPPASAAATPPESIGPSSGHTLQQPSEQPSGGPPRGWTWWAVAGLVLAGVLGVGTAVRRRQG
ncbi:MAG: hypothetical protein JOZ82_13275 [Marmoricola sp.]|nr:hypothetical protein [Marmoricola sp.]